MSFINEIPYEQSDLYKLRHTAAHVLAQAVLELYPQAKLAIGPPIADGFYYDFDLGLDENGRSLSFSPDDLPKLEKIMRRIIAGKHALAYREISLDEARQLFAEDPYKLELVEDIVAGEEDSVLSTYRHDSFEDLCRGPHVEHTAKIHPKAFKLMSIAGAYWRGDENQPMLQRIYGTAWENPKALKAHLQRLEEAKARDHRKLGRELEIFIINEDIGPGLPLWLPNGNILRDELDKLAREVEAAAGYQRVSTPHIAKEALFQRSGHLDFYEEDMFPPMVDDETRYFLKPMNCPFHHKIFNAKPRSYRDLPVRLTEYGMVYRYEQSGSLFGLMRVRGNQQNDAHIYCSEEQFEQEFMGVIDLYLHYFKIFGIEKYVMRFSKHDPAKLGEKYIDSPLLWAKTENMVREAMIRGNVPFVEEADEAAFYGPKIDVQIWSAIGREFSVATNQVDFAQPARLGLAFTNAQGEEEVPLCIHRAPLGSHERFIGFLIEHYAGKFPVWLAPQQVQIIPITDAHHGYAQELARKMVAAGIRAEAILGPDRMNRKIRQGQQMQVPYLLIVGDQEVADGTVSVRRRDGKREQGVGV
ncbi:MAG: threonine--tRNA ligase, partial [Chloroflexota bacterium]